MDNKISGGQRDQARAGFITDEGVENFHRIMRDVDAFIKSGDLDGARKSLTEAKKLEPANPYLKAFEERIHYLEKNPQLLKKTKPEIIPLHNKELPNLSAHHINHVQKQSEKTIRKEIEEEYKEKFTHELHHAEQSAARTLEEFEQNRKSFLQSLEHEFERVYQTQISDERKRIKLEAEAMIEAEKKTLQRRYDALVADNNKTIQKIREELHKKMEQSFLRRLEQISKEYDDKLDILGIKIPKTKEEQIALYREKMYEHYSTGQPSVEAAKQLMRLKELLELTFDEHFNTEAEVRLELYIAKLQKGILSGGITLKSKKKIEELKKQFFITKEQDTLTESFVKSSLNKKYSKGNLIIVDDDEALLRLLNDTLKENGFQVTTLSDVESAFQELKNEPFDLILCDIKFPQGDLDGFKLFTSVQELPHLRKIPFIFMSALHDGVIMRSGFQLGVDDYLTKPLDLDILMAIINGKIKRYQALEIF
jgi:CheY-like chemotaxis protein